MKQFLALLLVAAGACLNFACVKSTSSSEYDSVWKPYSGTTWTKPSGIENFAATDGGFQFDATISTANTADAAGLKLTFVPPMYVISNIESGSSAQFAITADVVSQDSMQLVTPGTGGQKYTFFAFGRVGGNVQTFGKDSVLTTARSFTSGAPFTYSPSINPDSCSKRLSLQLVLNWKPYSGPAVTDTLKTTKISVKVKNMSLTVSGVDILK
jgi:hypothetical protein